MKAKYPRTPHLPFSCGATSDDKVLNSDTHFYSMDVVVTEKMDGENISIYNNGFHARSLDSKHKSYHSWLLSYISNFNWMLLDNERICGEYLYAKHSIGYDSLPSYFLAFSFWRDNVCLDWDDDSIEKLGLLRVPILYRGKYDSKTIQKIAEEVVLRGGEGIVVRNSKAFEYEDFGSNIAKYVRRNHVQTEKHWSQSIIESNGLKKD